MAWVAVDENGEEALFECKPIRNLERGYWECNLNDRNASQKYIVMFDGTIELLIGRELTWDDEPVELKEEKE